MDKKASIFLGQKTLGIVIAIVCILILVYLGFQLYAAFLKDKTDLEKAELHLKKIGEIIDDLGDGESGEYFLYSPEKWMLIGWPSDEGYYLDNPSPRGHVPPSLYLYGDDKPKQCLNNGWENCLCLCDYKFNAILEKCDKVGICQEINYDELIVNKELSRDKKSYIMTGNNLEISLNGRTLRISVKDEK
jgi:hypothetical protein